MTAADFLSKYEIDFSRSLDQKGLGSVYTAKKKETDELFALKIIELHPLFDKGEVKERFDFAGTLKNSALLPYYECHRFPNEETVQHFVLMPYFDKGSLADNLEEIGFNDKLRLLEKILLGLAFLHENNCSWQVLRSDHVLLKNEDNNIQPQFINYGSKVKINSAFLTNFEYLAPEQLNEGDENFSGPAADIWAFSVLAFEVFSGQLPFGRKTVQNPNKKIMERIFRLEIADLFDKIPEEYVKIIKKSLCLNPSERPSAVEILELLREKEIVKPTKADKEIFVLRTLEKMGDDYKTEETNSGALAFFSRKIKRKASAPLSLWEPILWMSLALLAGYLISKL
jgi:serine/threonine protein kinase